MPLTYPHFGSLTYLFESMFRDLGQGDDLIIPSPPSRKTAKLGAQHAPEFICTPFKLTLGTFIESLERGATDLAIGGGHVYCRFGLYWLVQKYILEDLGYDFRFFTVDYDHPLGIIRDLKKNFGQDLSYSQIFGIIRRTWRKNRLTDLVDKLKYKYRALELDPGQTERLAYRAYRQIVDAKSMREIRHLQRALPHRFATEIEVDTHLQPLRIGIVGEIYVVLEPALNVDIFRRLNKLGVITHSAVSLRRFIDIGRKLNPFKRLEYKIADQAAKPYLAHRNGGEAQESIGEAILYKKKGWDGMIHLYPFTCMPEIISRSILPQVSLEHDIPVLSLVVDEQTGEAGFQTRLEAFVDLLRRKRN